MDADPFAGTEEIEEVGTVGQTVRIGRVEITGGESVLGDGCLGCPPIRWSHHRPD